MRVTVDASVAVKWFVAEPLHEEARLLVARRIRLHAPDLLLAEFANTVWKKARRKELPDARPYLDELSTLPGIVALRPIGDIAERAAQLSLGLDHPIYDCLYLACAEITDSTLLTADKRFADKADERTPGVRTRYLGAPGVTDWIDAAATAPVIGRETVEALASAYEIFAKTEESVRDVLSRGELRFFNLKDAKYYLDSPSYKRLVGLIGELNDEERVDLLALGWFGAERFPDWRSSLEHAENNAGLDPGYAAGYGLYWLRGYARAMDGRPVSPPR